MYDRKPQDGINNSKIEGFFKSLEAFDCRLYLCAKYMGSWLNIWCTSLDELNGELYFRVVCHSPQMINIDVFSPLG